MGDHLEMLRELRENGESCSQVMMHMTMMRLGVEDEHLIAAMKGLAGGMGSSARHACGILTGIASAMALADVKKGPELMFPEMYKWFSETYGEDHGGVKCTELLDGDFNNRFARCSSMIEDSLEKAAEILSKYGF